MKIPGRAMKMLALSMVLALFVTPALAEEEAKHGLSVAERKQVFQELYAAERRAKKDAAKQHAADPQSQAQVDLERTLAHEYKTEVAERHGLTEKQAVLIIAEGYREKWSVSRH